LPYWSMKRNVELSHTSNAYRFSMKDHYRPT
jgi:hypothetical protein